MATTAPIVCSFPGNPVAPATEPLPTVAYEVALKHALGDTPLEAYSRETKPLISPEAGGYAHGFLAAVNTAYQNHYPLVLSPDMVWLLIAQGFAIHLKENAEALREKFVAHEGKIELEVRRDAFVKGFAGNDWQGVFAELSQQIRTHIGEQAHATLVPTFSTTGIVEKAAFEVTLMEAMQEYFDFAVMTVCGIPTFHLEGTPDDWRSLRERAAQLSGYELSWWTEHLLPVLDECIAASEGRANPEFWQEFYKRSGGSGGPYITGQIISFFPYFAKMGEPTMEAMAQAGAILEQIQHEERGLSELAFLERVNQRIRQEIKPVSESEFSRNPYLGKLHWNLGEGLTSTDLPSAFSVAPFTWKYLDFKHSMEFVAGFVGASQDPETLAVRPEIGWAVRENLRGTIPV